MSDDIRKDGVAPEAGDSEEKALPHREEVMPKDHETYTPQGGGSGTGSGPIKEVEVAEKASEVAPVRTLPQVTPEAATAEAMGLTVEDGGAADMRRRGVSNWRRHLHFLHHFPA